MLTQKGKRNICIFPVLTDSLYIRNPQCLLISQIMCYSSLVERYFRNLTVFSETQLIKGLERLLCIIYDATSSPVTSKRTELLAEWEIYVCMKELHKVHYVLQQGK